MTRTRMPVGKNEKIQPNPGKEASPKKRNVKKDTEEVVAEALDQFLMARNSFELAECSCENDSASSFSGIDAIKKIRAAQKSLRTASEEIGKLRNSVWKFTMLHQMASWNEYLDTAWETIFEGIDK